MGAGETMSSIIMVSTCFRVVKFMRGSFLTEEKMGKASFTMIQVLCIMVIGLTIKNKVLEPLIALSNILRESGKTI